MTAIQTLMDEHRMIERAITALTAYARAAAKGAEAPRSDLALFVGFIQDYADSNHHGKEEDILFRAMVDNGMPIDGGPLAVMLAEHAEGRRLAGSLAELAAGEGGWEQGQRQRLLFAATGYARLLQEHIQKEDRILYPMAVRMLPDDIWRQIEEEFSAFQAATHRAEQVARLKQTAEELAKRYAPNDEIA